MKNKKLATGVCSVLLLLLLLAGCQSKAKKNREITRKFTEWVVKKADMDALSNLNNATDLDYYDNFDDTTLRQWLIQAQLDSARYHDALVRDAGIALKYAGECETPECVMEKINNAPKYTYGPGSVEDENGEWIRKDSVNNGASPEDIYRINRKHYTKAVRKIRMFRYMLNNRSDVKMGH